jgi:SpoVK/Ycf46/Vps4 family AAA+-type ATPase
VSQITDADVDLDELGERSQYFSAADIEFAARKAAQAAFERSLKRGFEPDARKLDQTGSRLSSAASVFSSSAL